MGWGLSQTPYSLLMWLPPLRRRSLPSGEPGIAIIQYGNQPYRSTFGSRTLTGWIGKHPSESGNNRQVHTTKNIPGRDSGFWS